MNKINDRYIKIDSMQHFCRVMDLGEDIVFLAGGEFFPADVEMILSDVQRLVKEGHYYHDTKPKKQVVDMEPFTRNGLDCEFWNDSDRIFRIGKLSKIIGGGIQFRLTNGKDPRYFESVDYCKPRLNHVFIWEGQELPEGLFVEYGLPKIDCPGKIWWVTDVYSEAIVARITGTKDGYCFPGCE